MSLSRIESDVYVNGNLNALTMTIPSSTITNTMISGAADISATKLEHRHQIVYAQESATSAADESRVVHVCYGATGTLNAFEAGSVVAAEGDDTCTVNLKVNGTSVLNPTTGISLTSSATAYISTSGTISSGSITDGDVVEITIDGTHSSGTLAKGVYASLVITEKAS